MLKVLERRGIQGPYINIVKAVYRKPVDIIKLKVEKLEVIPLKPGTRQGYHFSTYQLSLVLEILVREIRHEKEDKVTQIGKEEVKLPLFTVAG